MKALSIFVAIATSFAILSCVQPPSPPPAQALLCDLASANCGSTDGFFTFENDTIQVVYVFWAENGALGIFIHNKLAQPIYVDWKKGSFITGSTKHDYWDETYTAVTNGSATSSFWKPFFERYHSLSGAAGSPVEGFSTTFWSSVTTITKPERITFIPPGTTISRSLYSMPPPAQIVFDPRRVISFDTTLDGMPTHIFKKEVYMGTTYEFDSVTSGQATAHLSCENFTPDSSPLSFRSFLTYSTTDKFTSEAFIDNAFCVSKVTVLSPGLFKYRTETPDGHNAWATPRSYYVFQVPRYASADSTAP